MADDTRDPYANALSRALSVADLYDDGEPRYSTADIHQNPMAGVGSRLGHKWSTPEQEAAFARQFAEAENKPTIIGKAMGYIPGLDEAGERGRTSWRDALYSTAASPRRLASAVGEGADVAGDAVAKALGAAFNPYLESLGMSGVHGWRPEYHNVFSEENLPPSHDTQLTQKRIGEGTNIAGTAAMLSPATAFAAGAIPENAAGIFGGRLAREAEEPRTTRAYHWSRRPEEIGPDNKFAPFTHFGPAEAAEGRYQNQILQNRHVNPETADHGGTFPVDLDISNPLRIADFYKHDPETTAALID